MRLPLIFVLALTASPLLAQSIRYEVPANSWPANLGSHRAVVHVDKEGGGAHARLEWRRRDPQPEAKGIVVVNAVTGKRVEEAAATAVTSESGEVYFQSSAPGDYYVYFLPGEPGRGSFPQAKYVPATEPSAALKSAAADATVVRWEARTEHDRFTEMEIVSTAAERAAWLQKQGPQAYFVFPETRERSVRMFDHLPEIWLKRESAPVFIARVNEYYPFQLGVWAARKEVKSVTVSFTEFASSTGGRIPMAALHCLQARGIGWNGQPQDFTRPPAHDPAQPSTFDVPAGHVLPLWCALDLSPDVVPGKYTGIAEIAVQGQPPQRVPLTFEVSGPALADRGDSAPERLTKLRWLDSTIAQDDEIVSPYTPLRVEGRTISLLGRSVTLGDDGLPQQIASYFHPGVTRIVTEPTPILDAPMRWVVETNDGRALALRPEGFRFMKSNEGVVEWTSRLQGGGVTIDLHGHMEFDGHIEIRTHLTSASALQLRDVRLEIPRTSVTTPLMIGLGEYGGKSPEQVDWKWDAATKHQDAVWLGTVNAGLRVQLRAENYMRPYVNIHYPRQPLNTPPSWGGGGIRYQRGEKQTPVVCYSGPLKSVPGSGYHFDFDLSITPFHLLNLQAQWTQRYYHTGNITDPLKVRELGANVINIHQGNTINPYINYPFLTAAGLKDYAAQVHAGGLRVKYYYTVRELTNWTPELFAARAFGGELISRGEGEGHAWCEEHLGGQYWQAWAEPRVNDSSILTSSMSRWNNLYVQGLDWLVKNAGCDGLYLDDISYDRTVTKRARKILDRSPELKARGGGLIDLHSWNEIGKRSGFASCALIFMDSLPYVDRLWFGEGHPYNGAPEQTLTAISGIPFGLMGEMLQDGGNRWLGLTFGMTGRLGWGGHPEEVWKLWDSFGVADSNFIGWWDPTCPVKSDSADVKVTVWKKAGQTLVAVGNFSDQPLQTKLVIDWKALGLDPAKAMLYAPAMENFQPESFFRPNNVLALAPKRGLALWIDETPRTHAIASTELSFNKLPVLFEDRFIPQAAGGWTTTAKKPDAIKFDGEGQVFLTPANTHAWTARPLPPEARVIAAQFRQDAGDKAQQWGPGLAVVWPDGKFLKINLRDEGRFGLSINGRERLAGQCDRELPVTLAVVLDDRKVRIVALGEGAFQQEQELASFPREDFPGAPQELRLGKMPNSLQPADGGAIGEMGWSRVDWVRIFGSESARK